MSKPNEDVLTVKLELGHRADFKAKPSPEGFTHDWTVFVRGPDGSNIHHYVEKVVFYLHTTFTNPKRVITEPPFEVSESGYAGFHLPIEVYFKNKQSPRKIRFDYDLYLNASGDKPINTFRQEKLKFKNPTDDFRQKLLKAGAVSSLGNNNTSAMSTSVAAQPFSDLFGPPIKATTVDSPKKSKNKDKEKGGKSKPSPTVSTSEKELKTENSSQPHLISQVKDISNACLASKDSILPHKDKDNSSFKEKGGSSYSHKERERDTSLTSLPNKEKDGKDSSALHKDTHTSSSNKDRGGASSHKDGSKKSNTFSSSKEGPPSASSSSSSSSAHKSSGSLHKTTHKDSNTGSGSTSKSSTTVSDKGSPPSTHKKSSKEKEKKKDKDKSKEINVSQLKRTLEMSPSGGEVSTKKKKSDAGQSSKSSKPAKSEHDKPSKGSSSKSVPKHKSSTSHKLAHRKEDSKDESSTRSTVDSELKSSHKKSKSKDSSVSDKGQIPKKPAPSKVQRQSSISSLSSDVSTDSSLIFSDEEIHGPDISSLMASIGSDSADDEKLKSKPPVKLKQSSNVSSPASPSQPPSKSTHPSSAKKKSPLSGKDQKQSKHHDNHANAPGTSPSHNNKERKTKKKSSERSETRPEAAASQPQEPKKQEPDKAADESNHENRTLIISSKAKLAKRKKESSEEEGELSSSSMELSSDSNYDEGESNRDKDDVSVHAGVHDDSPAPTQPIGLGNGVSAPLVNGKPWTPDDLCPDSGIQLRMLLQMKEDIDHLNDPDALDEIVDMLFDADVCHFTDGQYEMDLCRCSREQIERIQEILLRPDHIG